MKLDPFQKNNFLPSPAHQYSPAELLLTYFHILACPGGLLEKRKIRNTKIIIAGYANAGGISNWNFQLNNNFTLRS